MNAKKESLLFVSIRRRNRGTAITLRGLFNLCAFFSCFTLAAGQTSVVSSSTADTSPVEGYTNGNPNLTVTSAYSSHSVHYEPQSVNHTNTSALTSSHNKISVISILQSSNFVVTGSTEPTLMALSFITTTASAPSVPRSVRTLLGASSFSIPGFTEPLSLALFTSESLTSNESVSSLSPNSTVVLSPSSILSSLHATNASVLESTSEDGTAKRTLSNSIKNQSSFAVDFVSAAVSNSSYLSVSSTKSFQSSLHQSPSLSQARYPGATTSSNYSNSQPFMSTLSLSSAQNAPPVTPYGSVSTPVPVLSKTRSLVSPIDSSKSYNQSSLVIQQTVARQASSGFNGTTASSNETSSGTSANFPPLLRSISSTFPTFQTTTLSSNAQQTGISQVVTMQTSYGINATTISSSESSFTTSTNVNLTSSLDIISATPTMTVSRSISFRILTSRATALSSHVQSMGDSSSASYAVYDGKSSVISATLLQNISRNDSRSYSETDSGLAASPLAAVSSSLISSIGRPSFFATDPSPLQPTQMMSKRHTTFYSSYSLLSSYLLTETFSFAVSPGVESLSSLGTVTSSQGPPRTSWGVMQLSTAVMSHSSLLVHSMVPVSVTMHTPRYSVSSPVDYFTSTDAQLASNKSKLSSNFPSSFDLIGVAPTSPLPQSISFTNLGLRTTTLSSHFQQARITSVVSKQTSSSFNETTISSNQTSFGVSVNVTSSFNLIRATPILRLPRSISSTISTFRITTFSSNIQQTETSQAVTRQTSYGINATTISSNESSFTTSTNVNLTSSLDIISATPTMTVSRSISFGILTFRATALSSRVQSMGDSSAFYAVYDGKSSVISATLLQNVSRNDSRSYSETDSLLAASPLTAVSSSLISSIGRTSFFATDPSPLQPTQMMSKRHTTFYSSYSLLSSYLLTKTFSFAVSPGVESLSSLGTVTSSQGPPRTSWGVMQLSTAVMSHSSLLVHSMVPVSVTMHTPRYSMSSPVDYFTSTDAQPPSTKSKLSSKFSTASASESTLAFPTILHTTLISRSNTSSQNGESTLAANGSATFTAVSSLANTSISSGSKSLQPNLSKKYFLSTIVNPVQSTFLRSTETLKLTSETLKNVSGALPSSQTLKYSPSSPVLALHSSEVSVSPSMPSSDSVGLNPQTFSVSGALSASETVQLSSLTSVLVSKSSEVQVSPSLPLSLSLSRDPLLLTSRTVMTARTTLTTTGAIYSNTALAIESSQVSSRSQSFNVLSLTLPTLKASSGFVSSRSTSFKASLPQNLSRTFNAPESVSLKTSSSNLNSSSLTLFQERTLSSKSSFFKPPPTSFVLPTAKFTSTNVSRTVNDPFSVLRGVSSTALSLSSLASFQGSTLQPSLRRPTSNDLSISTSPSLDFGSTLNVTESRLHTEDSSALFSSSRKPFQESSLASQLSVPRPSTTGIMSSDTFNDTQSVLHRQNSTSLNFVLLTSLQGSTVSTKSSPLRGNYSTISTSSQYASSLPKSLNLSSGLSERQSVLHIATSLVFSSTAPSKESSLFTMLTSTKVSSSDVFNDSVLFNSFSWSTALSGYPLIYSSMTLSLTPTVRLSLNSSVFMASSVDKNSRALSSTMSRPTMNTSSLIETRVARTSLLMVLSYTTPLATISVTKTSGLDSSLTGTWTLSSTAVSQNLTRISTAVWKSSTTLLFKLTSIGINQTLINVAASSQALRTPVFSDISKRKYSLSTIVNPVQPASITLHQASSSMHIQSSNFDDASVVTSSSEMSYFSPAPSTANLVFSSSVIATTPGFFVRFLINVDLKQNVSNISFVKQLEERILDAYRIGSASGAQNSSVRINQISRSPDKNSTNVTVTFRVFNGSEPVLAYTVIQAVSNGNLTETVKYKVIVDPFIVNLASSSSSSMLVTSIMILMSFTSSISQAPYSSYVLQSSSQHSIWFSSTQSDSTISLGEKSISLTRSEGSTTLPSVTSLLSRSIFNRSQSIGHSGNTSVFDTTIVNTSNPWKTTSKTEMLTSAESSITMEPFHSAKVSSIMQKPSWVSLDVTISATAETFGLPSSSSTLILQSSQVKVSPSVTFSNLSYSFVVTPQRNSTSPWSFYSSEISPRLSSSSDQPSEDKTASSMALSHSGESRISTARGGLESSETSSLHRSNSTQQSSDTKMLQSMTKSPSGVSLVIDYESYTTDSTVFDSSDSLRQSSNVMISPSMTFLRSSDALKLTSKTLNTVSGALTSSLTLKYSPSTPILALHSSQVSVSPSMPSSDSVGLNPQTFSVSGALSASETVQLSSLTSSAVFVSRSSEVQVSPSLPLSPLPSRDTLLLTSRTGMPARTTLTTTGTMYSITGLAIESSQVSSRSQSSNVPSLPLSTLNASSGFVSSRSTSFKASLPQNLSRTVNAPESVSLKTSSSNLTFSSLTLFQERTLSSKSSFFRLPPTSFVLPTAKFTSTNISRTVNDPFSVLRGVSSTALSLSSLASFQGSTPQPSLRRPSPSDFRSSQPTLSISMSPSLDFRSTVNVSDSPLYTDDSPGLVSSSRKPFHYVSLTSQSRVPRPSATGFMSSNTFSGTQSVLHRQNSTSLNFVLLTSLQRSTVSPKSSSLRENYSTVSTSSQDASSFPRSLNLSSGLSNRNSVLLIATSVIFTSAAPSKESSLFTMLTSTKVSSSDVFNDSISLNSFSRSAALSGTPLIYSSMTLSLTPTVRLSLNSSVFMVSSVDENSRALSTTMSRPTMNASSLIETRVTRTSLFMVPSYTTPLATISITKTSRTDSSSTVNWALSGTAVSQNLTRVSTAVWKSSTTLLFKLTSIGINQTSINVAASIPALRTSVFSDISKRTIERGSIIGTMSTHKVSRDTISSLHLSVFPSFSITSSSSSSPALYSVIINVTTSMRPSVNKTSFLDLATLQGSNTASLIAKGTTSPKLRTSRVKLSSLTGGNISSSSVVTLLASFGVTTTSVTPTITQVLRLSEFRTVSSAASSSRVNFPTSPSVPLIILSTLTTVTENSTSATTVSLGVSVNTSIQRMSTHSTLTSHLSKGFSKMTSSPKVQVNISEIGFASTSSKPATRITAEEGRLSSFLSLGFSVGYITTGSTEIKGTSSVFSASLVSPMTSFLVKNNSSSLSAKAEVDMRTRGTRALNLVSSSAVTVQKSSGLSFSKSLLSERTRVLPSLSSSVLGKTATLSSRLSVSVRLETSMLLKTGSGILPSMTVLVEGSSSLLKRGLTYSTSGTPTRLSLQTLSSPVISSRLPLSSLLQARSSLPPLLPSSFNPSVTFTNEVSVQLSTTGLLKTHESSTTMPHSLLVSLPNTHEVTSLSTISASSLPKSSPAAFSSVNEPVSITLPNTTESEGLVGIQILVPKTENETEPAFKERIELRLAAAYRLGTEKPNTRAKRDLERIVGPALSWNGRTYNSWKQSPSFKVYQRRAIRFRRQVDRIVAVIEEIRRAKPIVGEEVVDIEYRMFDGSTMLSAEHIVQTFDKLSEAELVTTLKYSVTLRPYVVKEVQVTPAPSSASKWDILIPAILVPVCVTLFLLIALICNKCASKRKRKRQKIEPTEEEGHRYETLQIRTFPSVNVIPLKNMGPPKNKRLSISSASSSDIPSKCPSIPPPDYSPGPSVTPEKPNQHYRRRAHDRHGDFKDDGQSYNAKVVVNGHIQQERALKKSQDGRDSAKTDHPAGVLENRPLMRNERLTNSLTREEPSVKFTSLPPLVKTSLIGPKATIRNTATSETKDYARIIAESGVPQEGFGKMIATERHYVPLAKLATINEEVTFKEKEDALFLKAKIERWRNKMRHRERLRLEQDLREKEHEKQRISLQQLNKGRKEENEKSRTEDQASISQRSLNAERKRRSRLERWRNNRVGTSSSKSSSSHSSSSSSSSASGSDSGSKEKQEKHREKRKRHKMKKDKKKVPPLAVGHAATAAAQEALRETAWTIKETPGVQLISVKPINEQRDRTQYLMDTGYQIYPMVSNPSFEPRQRDDGDVYENMEGGDPYIVQYSDDYLPEPRQAFGGPSVHEDEHIHDEPRVIATSPSQTHLVLSPRDDQTRAMVPIQYARGFTGRSSPMSRGRPASAISHPGLTKKSGTRPTSARTDPMPRYAPPPGRTSPANRAFAGPNVPGSRYMLANQPTVATASQPSIGTSPRYMVDPERQRDQPPSSFQGARMILSRAQSNIDRFEDDSNRNILEESDVVPASESLYTRPQKRAPSHASTIRKEPSPKGTSRLDVTAREHAELEAQLLVSRALARARNNERHKEMHSSRKGTVNVMQFLTKKSIVRPLQRTSNKTNEKKEKKKSKTNSTGSSTSSSSSSSSSDEIEKKMKSENNIYKVARVNGHS